MREKLESKIAELEEALGQVSERIAQLEEALPGMQMELQRLKGAKPTMQKTLADYQELLKEINSNGGVEV